MAAGPKLGDRVYLGKRRSPFRVTKHVKLRGERAVELMRASEMKQLRDSKRFTSVKAPEPYRVVCVVDLVRSGHGEWRERWRQADLLEGFDLSPTRTSMDEEG